MVCNKIDWNGPINYQFIEENLTAILRSTRLQKFKKERFVLLYHEYVVVLLQ